MAKRSAFTDDDLEVISDSIAKRIEAEVKTESVETLAPLFRVREKITARLGTKAQPQTRTRSTSRSTRVVTPPAATAGVVD